MQTNKKAFKPACCVSVPIGTLNGLPVGGQFLADRWREDQMVRAAAGLERLLG